MQSVVSTGSTDSLHRYLRESARPLSSMVFVAPMLLVYELGSSLLGSSALQNGADVWLRRSLQSLGFQQHFLLPLLACAVLLGWHHLRRDRWELSAGVLPVMLTESLLYAFILFSIAHLQHMLFAPQLSVHAPDNSPMHAGTLGHLIGYCGAGIYEELLFRLLLLRGAVGLFRWLGATARGSIGWAIFGTSFVFSAAHYQLFAAGGYPFDWYSFSFRFLAGIYFGLLFVTRGFGIAAGTHALYDILVELL